MTGDYPKRQKFYALRFTRVMAKDCLANLIGPEACWLLSVIVHTEDAKGYRAPVTFFNEQLMPLVGCKNVKALARVRDKAIKAGWLAYVPGAKGIAGQYWVTIPERNRDWDDGPTDESQADESAAAAGYSVSKSTTEAGSKREQSGHESGNKVGTEAGSKREQSGQHSSLTLSLTQEEDPPTPPRPGGSIEPAPAAVVPPELDTPDFRAAWGEWKAERREKKTKPYTPRGEAEQFRKLAPFGPAVAVAAIRESIAQGWQGLFPEKHATSRSPPARRDAGQARQDYVVNTIRDALESD